MTDSRVERLVLRHLEGRPLNRAELVSRTGATDHQVQAVLDELIGTSHIVRRPQDVGPADYELTPLGVERLADIGRITAAPIAKPPAVVKRRPPQRLRQRAGLTEREREWCSEALTREYRLGRIGDDEMARRTDLLYRARNRHDVDVVFEGLAGPGLPKPVRRTAQPSPAPAPRAPRFEAEPKPDDRELIANLAKSLVVGLVFAGVIILSGANVILLLVAFVVTAGNMFASYRSWADKRRSK